ncbi:MAG TPA: exodeoxyribonuclease I [Pseudoxanthomonas sp.]|nr:exodeoxyribonuclease I [Pseudoxanthomonas sp.]
MPASFLFYDLETFGGDPRRTRVAQFAAVRTDADLVQVEEPVCFFVRPADDLLPSPGATLVTGITPQHALREGIAEAEAFARIAEELSRPETCTLGWNSLRFDDEFIRHGLFRNFHDPYEREWRGGNCRWDLLDAMRLAHALRPEGLVWPRREDGATSFKLEHLALANGVRQGDAHEALSDVHATLGLARLFRGAQPRLWDYALKLRDKRFAATLLDATAMQPALHVSQRYPASRLCAAPVLPLARHPRIDSRVIVFDLEGDADALLALDADEIADRLYTPAADLPPGERRIPLKEVHLNRAPALVAWPHLRGEDFERLRIDRAAAEATAACLRPFADALAEKMRRVFGSETAREKPDPDAALYDGFISDGDKRRMAQVRATPPDQLRGRDFAFGDPRLAELLFRYRARNWPHTLDAGEQQRWDEYRRRRLDSDCGLSECSFETYEQEIAALRVQHAGQGDKQVLLDQLQAWAQTLRTQLR